MDATAGLREPLLLAFRELFAAEARLAEAFAPRGIRVRTSIADRWPLLHEYLQIYASGLSPAGMLVLGGRPEGASSLTGIPFTAPAQAGGILDLAAASRESGVEEERFWEAVRQLRERLGGAPLEGLLSTVLLAHASPFDVPVQDPLVQEASATHVRRLLQVARPQAVVAVGSEALLTLGRALGETALEDLSRADEASWLRRWPPGTRLASYPAVDAPARPPFRMRVVPVPRLVGACGREAGAALEGLLAYAWA